MDKWKLVAILALVSGLGGYGWYSSQAGTTPPPPEPTPAATPAPVSKLEGQPLPSWDIPDKLWTNTAKPIKSGDLKGSVALIEFFRVGCSHCEEAAPFMQQVFQKYGAKGLKMVAIQSPSVGSPEENDWNAVKAKIGQWGVKYPIAFDEGGKLFREKYGLKIFPTVLVIDKAGVVRYFKSGHTPETAQALTAYLDKALAS